MINLGSARHVARKAHRCDSCGGRINPGEPYIKDRIVDGLDAWTWKAHTSCNLASKIAYSYGVEGDEGCWRNVSDFDGEDRWLIYINAPEVWQAIWGGARDFAQNRVK